MSTTASRASADPAILSARRSEDVVVGDEIVRHRLASRVIHWTVALFFFLALFSGLPIWTPVFGWMASLFGGLSVCRILHPWGGVAFSLASIVMFFHWLSDMYLEKNETDGHLTGNAYDRTVPIIFAGSAFKPGRYATRAEVVDIAPTLSYVSQVIFPTGTEGRVLSEALTEGKQ